MKDKDGEMKNTGTDKEKKKGRRIFQPVVDTVSAVTIRVKKKHTRDLFAL